MLNLELLRASIAYDAETGVFTRLVRSGNCRAGSPLGSLRANGYLTVSYQNQHRLAHRMAWLMQTGCEPTNDIDHIDGDRTNNRWSNLRAATRGENMQNERHARASNLSSGLLGVSWSKAARKWAAGIKINGKKRHLGLFDDKQAAHAVYLEAKREIHPFCTI